MENSNTGPVVNKGSKTKTLILFGLIILFIATLAYGYYQNKNNQSKNSTSSSEWTEFKSEKYGFKFDYPKEWGAPIIRQDKQQKGSTYSINFTNNPPSPSKGVIISMESEDLIKRICNTESDCKIIPTITKGYLEKQLQDSSTKFVHRNTNSYSVITTDETQKISALDIYQTINLPKLNVRAVHLQYYKSINENACPKNKLTEENKNCLTTSMLQKSIQILKSIRAI